jgi:membrane protein DedA with SNARE-associated domain
VLSPPVPSSARGYHDPVPSVNGWLTRQPLWRFILFSFIANSMIWSFVPYAAAWTSGGWHITSDDFGFRHGHLYIPYVLMEAGIVTVIMTFGHLRSGHRQAR